MTNRMFGLVGIAVLGVIVYFASVAAVAAPTTTSAPTSKPADTKEIKLTGTFYWNNKKDLHDIKITLTPKAAGEYDAVYFFKWGQDKKWKGTVKGDLKSGAVSGNATNEDGKRTFEFTGTAADGTIACKHTETTGGKPTPTGEMTLKTQ